VRATTALAWTVAPAEKSDGFPWPNDAKAAVVLTYDDGMDTHLDNAAPSRPTRSSASGTRSRR